VIRRTNAADLLVPFGVVAVIAYLLLRLTYSSLPPFQWFVALPIAALAILEVMVARRVRAAVRHRPGAKPMTALAIVRAVALGKASSLVGAAVSGAAAALALKVLPDANRTTAADHDLKVALTVLVVSVALVAAGLWLERAGIDPGHLNRDGDPT
jgi:hypothetical protein